MAHLVTDIKARECTECGKAIRTYTEQPMCHPCRAVRREAERKDTERRRRVLDRQQTNLDADLAAHRMSETEHKRRSAVLAGRRGPKRDRRPNRDNRTTTEQGYGYAHQLARGQLLRDLVPGTQCPLCGDPMYPDQLLDCDHSNPAARAEGAPGDRLAHQHCNRRDGATRSLRRQGKHLRQPQRCEVCGVEFQPHPNQKTCSRKCGWTIRRRTAPATPTP